MITFVDPEKQYKPDCGDLLWGAASDWAKPHGDEAPCQQRVSGLKLNVLDGTEFTDNEILLVSHVNANPMKAMETLEIDQDFFCPIKDPYTGYNVFGIMPVAVLHKGWGLANTYRERCEALDDRGCRKVNFIDLAFDQDFVKETIGGGGKGHRMVKKNHHHPAFADIFELGDIAKLMMGSGYTYGCSMNDGSHARIPVKVKMSNGDWLFVWVWEWYNK